MWELFYDPPGIIVLIVISVIVSKYLLYLYKLRPDQTETQKPIYYVELILTIVLSICTFKVLYHSFMGSSDDLKLSTMIYIFILTAFLSMVIYILAKYLDLWAQKVK